MEKKVIIIGAGLAGLSAGIHLQKSGIKTEIFEISGQAGGMCIAWERSGYRFDSCIHWMVGTKPGGSFNDLYLEVGALDKDTPIYNAEALKGEINNTVLEIPMNFSAFKDLLLKISPQDSKMIEDFCSQIEKVILGKMPTGAPKSLPALIRMLRENGAFLNMARKYTGMSTKEYLERFSNPALKGIISMLMPPSYSAAALFMMLGSRMGGNAGYPLGGAYEVVQRMEKKYRSLGGVIHFGSKVDEIIVESGKTTGVRTKGKTHAAGTVIAACDMYDTLKKMLGSRYQHKQLDAMLESAELFSPICYISYGLDRRFGIPASLVLECPDAIRTAPDFEQKSILVRSFDFDPSAAPENCSSVMVLVESSLDYWQKLRRENINEYKAVKQKLADEVTGILDKRFHGFRDSIKVLDISTPATYIRYCNVYKGSWEGFAPTPAALKTNIRKTVGGIKGLYLAGQWTTPGGGLCTAVQSGKEAAGTVIKAK
jgi:phytoene desaturase